MYNIDAFGQTWTSDSSVSCRSPSGVGMGLRLTGSVYGGTAIRTLLIKSVSAVNYSQPVIVSDTPQYIQTDLRVVLATGFGNSIGMQLVPTICRFKHFLKK